MKTNFKRIDPLIPDFNNGVASIADIGRAIGLTRERARQILKVHYGLDGKSTQRALAKSKIKDAEHQRMQKLRDASFVARYGASESVMTSRFGVEWRSSLGAYSCAKGVAKRKRVEWEIKYVDWLEAWAALPEATDKGRMCFVRKDNCAPFRKGNLRVVSMSDLAMEIRGRDSRCYKFAKAWRDKLPAFDNSETLLRASA